jgi:hypothetical protein
MTPETCGFATPDGGPGRACKHSEVEASGGDCRMGRVHTVEDELAANDSWRREQRAKEWDA